MNHYIIGLVSVLLISSQAVSAASIDQRQQNQQNRIEQGVESGRLTLRETQRLVKQQKNIAKTEARFKSDGTFTAKERVIVQNKLDSASQKIFVQKHDAQHR